MAGPTGGADAPDLAGADKVNLGFIALIVAVATIGGFMTATDLADYLVKRNMPFRQAHGVVGRIVALCQERDCELIDLTLAELQQFSELIESDIFAVLSVEGSINSRLSAGGTALVRVEEALNRVEQQLGMI